MYTVFLDRQTPRQGGEISENHYTNLISPSQVRLSDALLWQPPVPHERRAHVQGVPPLVLDLDFVLGAEDEPAVPARPAHRRHALQLSLHRHGRIREGQGEVSSCYHDMILFLFTYRDRLKSVHQVW